MNACFLPAAALLLSACSAVRTLPVQDSTRVEIRTEKRIKHDTAWVELPVIIEKRTTLDTASTLENTYAKSEARVAAGILHHSLETKAASVPVRVETKEVVRDSIVYRDRIQTRTIEVEKPLNWWQALRMKMGGLFLIIALGIVTYYIINLLLNLKFKKL